MAKEYDPADYNKSGMLAFLFCMVVTCLFFFYIAFVHKGVDLKEIPQAEVKAATDSSDAEAKDEKEQGE